MIPSCSDKWVGTCIVCVSGEQTGQRWLTSAHQTDTAGESGLSQLLMNEIMKLQSTVQEERRKAQELTMWLHTKEDTIREMWVRDSLLHKHQERAQKMKEERDSLSKELRKCKDENYNLAMSYAKQSEEKSAALMKNRDLILEVSHPFLTLPPSYLIPGRLCCAPDFFAQDGLDQSSMRFCASSLAGGMSWWSLAQPSRPMYYKLCCEELTVFPSFKTGPSHKSNLSYPFSTQAGLWSPEH